MRSSLMSGSGWGGVSFATINKGRCDLLIGIPANFRPVLTTTPYYRSTYVFVVRRDAAFKPSSLDDNHLQHLKIGVQAWDEQYTPPAEALMYRGRKIR